MSKATKTPMPPQDEPEAVPTTAAGRRREDAIRAGVLKALGRPAWLFRVAVVPLWDDHFRVNVVTGDDTTAIVIPNSFFVTADDRGNILGATPPIRKRY